MKTLKTLGLAGGLVAAALVGGTLISAVSAAPSTSSAANGAVADPATDAATAGKYCALWQKTFADKLGVSTDKLIPAAKAATLATIDAAVAAGDLPADVAARMKAEINKADGDGCRLLGAAFHRFGHHAAKVELRFDMLGAAATALGMDKADLVKALRNGDSLKKIAGDKGKNYADVSKAVHDAAKANLDALVKAGKLAQAREDAVLTQVDKWLAAGGSLPRGPGWSHLFHGPASTSATPAS